MRNLSFASRRRVSSIVCTGLAALVCGGFTSVSGALRSPVLLSTSTSTRAIALESVSMRAEPFSLNGAANFNSSDPRTRIALFCMNLDLLAGEGANSFTADAEDAAHNVYPLKVEFVGQVPPAVDAQGNITTDLRGIYMVIVRLNDAMTGNLGDVLIRLNLHGLSSNRVRLGIGQMTPGSPVDDSGAAPTPPPVTPPGLQPPLTPDSYTGVASDADTVRFLEQASWGPTAAELARVKTMGFKAYLNEQFNAPVTNAAKGSDYPDLTFPLNDQAQQCPATNPADPTYNQAVCNRDFFSQYPIQRTFFTNALTGQDQLRQRVAFALHQILVVSQRDENRPSWMTVYLQALDRNAFGNFRTLLREVTLSPAMGDYLDMRVSTRTNVNENFGREVLQLFSIGVNQLNLDGTPKVDAQGVPIPTYTQATVTEFTRLFTGWNLDPTLIGPGITNWRDPMVPRGGTNHDVAAKTLLNGASVPACTGTNTACTQSDLEAGLDNIFTHPNVGPFIGKQLIQHLVTSNPSPGYVQRVARVFNNDCDALYPDNCTNGRGNLRAVVQAILLDPEARGDIKTDPAYGKLREPIQLMTDVLRAFDAKSFDKSTTSDGVLANGSASDFPSLMDQDLFRPATVFSYFQPDYVVPGAKILGPAFGILSTTTTLRRANFVNTIVYTGIPTSSPNRPLGTSLDLSPVQALAPTPDQMMERLNLLLLHGTMSSAMRTSIINAINATSSTDQLKRAQVGAYLVATASQYEVQR